VLVLEKLLQQELGYFDEDENSVGSLTGFMAKQVSIVQGVAKTACRGSSISSPYSLSIDVGTVCALVGPPGAGKSTLVNLLIRFYDPQNGVISLDGRAITTLNMAWLWRQMGLVQQEPALFHGCVADNIRYGVEGATQDDIEEVAMQVHARLHHAVVGQWLQHPGGPAWQPAERWTKAACGHCSCARAAALNHAAR